MNRRVFLGAAGSGLFGLLFGGWGESKKLTIIDIWDPKTETWESFDGLKRVRKNNIFRMRDPDTGRAMYWREYDIAGLKFRRPECWVAETDARYDMKHGWYVEGEKSEEAPSYDMAERFSNGTWYRGSAVAYNFDFENSPYKAPSRQVHYVDVGSMTPKEVDKVLTRIRKSWPQTVT